MSTALAIETSCGYLLTMFSIRLMPTFAGAVTWRWVFLALVPGPIAGAWAMRALNRVTARQAARGAG